MPITHQIQTRSRSLSSSQHQRGVRKKAISNFKHQNKSLVKSIEIFIADIEANFGNKRKHIKKTYNVKKFNNQIGSDDLYDELDLWLLRLDSLFESLADKLNETLEILKRKLFQVEPKLGNPSKSIANCCSEDRVKVLTAEIDQIFGERFLSFPHPNKVHKNLEYSNMMSANELRDELERLLKGSSK